MVKQSIKSITWMQSNSQEVANLRHDNAPAHRSSLVSDFLEKHVTVTVPQPPYSPDYTGQQKKIFIFP